MNRPICLTLLGFAGCFDFDRADPEPTLLADLPGLRLTFGVGASPGQPPSMFLEIAYRERELGSCALLHASLRAEVGANVMTIQHPGADIGSESLECRYPMLNLVDPPPAESIVLEDASKQVTIDLGPRLVQLLPVRPWSMKAGETVEVPFAPASALPDSSVSLVFAGAGGNQTLPFGTSAGKLTFVAPDLVGPASLTLQVSGAVGPKPWPCSGAECRVVGASSFPVPVNIQPAQ